MKPGESAWLMMVVGLMISYVEFVRPGWVIPGVVGGVVCLVGVGRLWEQPGGIMAVGALAGALVLVGMGAQMRQVVLGAMLGLGVLWWGTRGLGVRWWMALGVGGVMVSVSGWLLAMAVRARWNKFGMLE